MSAPNKPVDMDWQISCHDIKSRNQYLFETGEMTDCEFMVGREPKNQKLISAHKMILAMASPVFHAMFYGSLPEKSIIHVTDLDYATFHALLKYIYTDVIAIDSVDEAIELVRAAKKYMFSFVVDKCITAIQAKLTPKTVLRVYEFATLFDETQLKERSLELLRKETLKVIQDDSFKNAEIKTVMMVVQQDKLNINSELELFKAINKYVTESPELNGHQINNTGETDAEQQSVSISIRNIIRHIRFLTMSPQTFAEGPMKTKLLTKRESLAMLANIASSNTDIPMPKGFSTKKTARKIQAPVLHSPVQVESNAFLPEVLPRNPYCSNNFGPDFCYGNMHPYPYYISHRFPY
ncbi:BTB/POZ domain-containing protein 6-like [Malaya genurostris]|uniref:BTB/POZ domain-containing protein 6-like n=1 Tax=Malaya genurostris TaxID=325434 RepID=UPI0026F3A554|nr:BTB/POZ domain-containing protein 6-like [Malaya genurostris]